MNKIDRKFAFMIHPLEVNDITRKFEGYGAQAAKFFLPFLYEKHPLIYRKFIMPYLDYMCKNNVFKINGIETSKGGIEGFFVGIPYTAEQIKDSQGDSKKVSEVLNSIVYAANFAQENGAFNLGLGAYTSVITNGGKFLEGKIKIPFTTGNTLTALSAVEAACVVAEKRGIDIKNSKAAVIGALGAVGSLCSCLIAKNVCALTIIGKNENSIKRLEKLDEEIKNYCGNTEIKISVEAEKDIKDCDIVISATNNVAPVINDYRCLKKNCVVADVARPQDISHKVIEKRPDVFVLDAGLIEIPGSPRYELDLGLPKGKNLACFTETVLNALQGIQENWSDYSVNLEERLRRVDIDKDAMEEFGFKIATDYVRRENRAVKL